MIPSQVKLVAGVVALLAAMAAIGMFIHHVNQAGYKRGTAEIQAKWDAEKVKAQQVALAKQAEYLATERAMADSVNAVVAHYRGVNQREKDTSRLALDAIRASGQRLSVPATCPSASSGGTASAATPAAGTPVPVRAELSRAASEFLVGEADRADLIVRTLNLCIETLAVERKAWLK